MKFNTESKTQLDYNDSTERKMYSCESSDLMDCSINKEKDDISSSYPVIGFNTALVKALQTKNNKYLDEGMKIVFDDLIYDEITQVDAVLCFNILFDGYQYISHHNNFKRKMQSLEEHFVRDFKRNF